MRMKKYVAWVLSVSLLITACLFFVGSKDVNVGKGDAKSVQVSTIEGLRDVLDNLETNAESLTVKDESVTVSISYQDNETIQEKVVAYLTEDKQYYTFEEISGGTMLLPGNMTYSYFLSVQKELYIENGQMWGRITQWRYSTDLDSDGRVNLIAQQGLDDRWKKVMEIQKIIGEWKPLAVLEVLDVDYVSNAIMMLGAVKDVVATADYTKKSSGYVWKQDINVEDYNDKPLHSIVVNVSEAEKPWFGVYSANIGTSNNVANWKLETQLSNIGNTKVERPNGLAE